MTFTNRIAHNTGVSEGVQGDIQGIIGQLVTLLADRDQQVKTALSDISIDEVDALYGDVERRWLNALTTTKDVIHLVMRTLGEDDLTAFETHGKAKQSILGIG